MIWRELVVWSSQGLLRMMPELQNRQVLSEIKTCHPYKKHRKDTRQFRQMDGDKKPEREFSSQKWVVLTLTVSTVSASVQTLHVSQTTKCPKFWRGTGNAGIEGRRKSGTDRPDGWEIDSRMWGSWTLEDSSCFSFKWKKSFFNFLKFALYLHPFIWFITLENS